MKNMHFFPKNDVTYCKQLIMLLCSIKKKLLYYR